MKRYIIQIVALSVLFSACNGFLEEEPESFLSPDTFFDSEENIKIAVLGIYDALGDRGVGDNIYFGNYNQGLLAMGALGVDQIKWLNDDVSNRFGAMDLYSYLSGAEIPTDVWRVHYVGINRANTVINRVEPLLNNASFNANELRVFLAEARFLRAFYYFNLVRYFGDVPLKLTETASLDAEDVISIERSPAVEVYTQIENDLKWAANYLPLPSEQLGTDNGRATKTAAWGLLARVYSTWAGYPLKDDTKWGDAADYAKRVIDSDEHALLSEFKDVFGVEDRGTEINDEVIFAVKFSNVSGETSSLGAFNGIVGANNANANTPDNSASFGIIKIERAYYDSFDPNDTRRAWTCADFRVRPDGTIVELTGNQLNNNVGLGKWRRDGTYVGYAAPYDYPLLRYADVLLMYAEAETMDAGGPTAGAYNALNMVRRRAFGEDVNSPSSVDYSLLSPDDFIETIIQERSWELCSEDGSRWHDLVRTEKLAEVVTSVKREAAVNNFDPETHMLFPIPLMELDANEKMVQNPGY